MYHTTNKISATIFYKAVNLGFEGTNKWKGRNSKKKWIHENGYMTTHDRTKYTRKYWWDACQRKNIGNLLKWLDVKKIIS